MIIATLALGAFGGLVVLAADEPAATVSPGNVVASDHLTAGCPTGELAVTMNAVGLADSPSALSRMVQAHCKAIAPDTRLLVTAPEEKGAIQVQPASGVAEPLFVVPGDFSLLAGRR